MKWFAAVMASTILGGQALGQDEGTIFFKNLNDYAGYSDIWGYRDPGSGREIAILSTTTGTSFVDATDPANAFELSFFSRNTSNWADARTYQNFAYVVTEGGGGMQIFNLADVDNIQLVTTYSGAFSSAHNVCIDTGLGILLAPGANTGMPILDLSNPIDPVQVANYTSPYVHDCHSQNGLVHLAQINSGTYQLLDINNLPTLNLRGVINTPRNKAHSAWPNASDTVTATTDETGSGAYAFYDISDPDNPTLLSQYSNNSSAVIHNAFINGDIAHSSYYTEGYVAVDISDPSNPVKVGQYDTYPGAGGGFDGAWGCYPFQPSGVIYISDQQTGLYLLALGTVLRHTALGDTTDVAGPYGLTVDVTTSTAAGPVSAVDLHYSLDDGQNYTTVALSQTADADQYGGAIPGQIPGSVVKYHVTAADSFGTTRIPSATGDYVFRVGDVSQHYFSTFEGPGDQGWTHSASLGTDDWIRHPVLGKAGDPSAAFSGTNVWGNDNGNGASDGAYPNNTANSLSSPAIDLSAVTGSRLRFQRVLNVEDAQADQATIQVNGVTVWSNPTDGLGTLDTEDNGQWSTFDIDISAEADGVATTQVTFNLSSNSFDTFGGWTIDDFEIYSVDECQAATPYGASYPGSGGFVPSLAASGGLPQLGNTSFQLDMAGLLGGATGFLLFTVDQASITYKDATILVNWFLPTLWFPATAGPGGPGAGTITLPTPLPADPTFEGVGVYCQLLVADGGATKGVATSNGLVFVLCP